MFTWQIRGRTLSILQQYIIMRRMGVHADGRVDPGTALAAHLKKALPGAGKQARKAEKKGDKKE